MDLGVGVSALKCFYLTWENYTINIIHIWALRKCSCTPSIPQYFVAFKTETKVSIYIFLWAYRTIFQLNFLLTLRNVPLKCYWIVMALKKIVWDIKNKNLSPPPPAPNSSMNRLLLATLLMLVMKRNIDDQGNKSPWFPMLATTMLTISLRRIWQGTRREIYHGLGPQIQHSLRGIGLISSLFQNFCWVF